jgi:hypothetical protein
MKRWARSALLLAALLAAAPSIAANVRMCPQLDGKHVKVTGILRNLMADVQEEPRQSPSTYFELEGPRWQCQLKKVYVDYPGRSVSCGEGRRVEVSGTYHDGSDLFSDHYWIDAQDVKCL